MFAMSGAGQNVEVDVDIASLELHAQLNVGWYSAYNAYNAVHLVCTL